MYLDTQDNMIQNVLQLYQQMQIDILLLNGWKVFHCNIIHLTSSLLVAIKVVSNFEDIKNKIVIWTCATEYQTKTELQIW